MRIAPAGSSLEGCDLDQGNEMSGTFEDSMQEILESMLSVCLEYSDDRANGIYLYCSAEQGLLAADVFYEIGAGFYEKHLLNKSVYSAEAAVFNTSEEHQSALLDCLLSDLKQLIALHDHHHREPPTEIKASYDVVRRSLAVEYGYALKYSNHDTLMANDIFQAWFEERRWQRPRIG